VLCFCRDLLLGRSTLNAQSRRVILDRDAIYEKTIDAIRENQKIPIELRSFRLQVVDHHGKARKLIAAMLYEPQSKFFFWEYLATDEDLPPNWYGQQVAWLDTIYVFPDKLVIFTAGLFSSVSLSIVDSAERRGTIEEALDTVVSSFGKKELASHKSAKAKDYLKEMPRDFLEECLTDVIYAPRVEEVQRQGGQWNLKLREQNGNIAEISLDESYNLLSKKFIIDPPGVFPGGCPH
jgi:hypothetical protein